MKIRHLSIKNFRGIKNLDWTIKGSISCLIGPGDSTKTTILDAIELALYPNWNINIDDSDFYNADTNNSIEIVVSVGELPASLLSDDKFGFYTRGWSTDAIKDEPEEHDELILSIKFHVDNMLEPSWSVINDRSEGKVISYRDRDKLNVNRLGQYVDRHLSWSRGSPLMKLTEHLDSANEIIRSVHRRVKETADFQRSEALTKTAEQAVEVGKKFGIKNQSSYTPNLDTKALNTGLSAVYLHDGNIPLRAKGLGTRRLLALSLQYQTTSDGGIILIDEVESGLEPYRLRHLLRTLKENSNGQVFITSHSSTTIVELDASSLCIVRSIEGITKCTYVPTDMQATIRGLPDALLARKVLVCEGKTEFGIFRSIEKLWVKNGQENLAYLGVVLIEGGGDTAPLRALQLAKLGYDVCLFMDSDKLTSINPSIDALKAEGVKVIHWGDEVSTEERVFLDLPLDSFNRLLKIAEENKGRDSIISCVSVKAQRSITEFEDVLDYRKLELNESEYRRVLGRTAKERAWYKRIDYGELLGEAIAEILDHINEKDIYFKLSKVEEWVYG